MNNTKIKFAYFGGEPLGVPVLEELKKAGLLPSLIVCSPDKPVGRKQVLTPPPVKVWAKEHGIAVYQPESYKGEGGTDAQAELSAKNWDVFAVVAYNHILPQWLLDIPKHGVVNVHPSLLPSLRGASPIRTAILKDRRDDIGVSVMLLDEQMDHGPILEQMHMPISNEQWPMAGPTLDKALARMGGALLADALPAHVAGEILPQEQDHAAATYCGKLTKADSEIKLDPHNLPTGNEAQQLLHKVYAFTGIGDTFFMHDGKRVKINKAECSGGTFRPVTVTPEGKSPVPFLTWNS